MEDLLNEGLLLFGNAALAALAAGLAWLTKWIATKIKNEKVAGIVTRVDDVAMKVVRDVYQTYVSALKVGKEDGKLSMTEKAEAKRQAKVQLKSYIGAKGLKEIAWLLGGEGGINDWLGSVVENAVTVSKNVGSAAKGASGANPS